jgi:Outer membrane protein beta-barrel domain
MSGILPDFLRLGLRSPEDLMFIRRTATALVLVCALIPSVLQAQTNPSPNGVWVSAGVGSGWARVACGICTADRQVGPTGYLRVGTSITPGLLLGAEANAWTRDNDEEADGRDWTRALSAVAFLYPRPAGSLYVKGGVGYINYHAEPDVSTGNIGLQLGAGYEFRLGRTYRVNNFVNLLASSFGSLRTDDAEVVDDVSVTLLQFGVGLTRR